jgi:arylsulfatase
MEAAGKLNKDQRDIFLKPRPTLELYDLRTDPHQLRNLIANKKHAPMLSDLIRVLDRWAEDTGDTVPKNPTNDRQDAHGKRTKNHKRGTMPGEERGATKINHPGPVRE